MAIERDSRDRTFFFCISRGGSARLALVRQTRAATTVPCRSIESYLSMGNNMVARKTGEEEKLRPVLLRANERKRDAEPSHRTQQPRLSYADCSEQLDFNTGINPLPLNFILGE